MPLPTAPSPSTTFRGRRSAIDPFADMLGRVPDAELARLAGVTAENVRTYRARRGIEAQWQSGVATPAVKAAPPPAAPAEETDQPGAFLVGVTLPNGNLTSFAVIGPNMLGATTRAETITQRHFPGASIKGVQFVAPLLK